MGDGKELIRLDELEAKVNTLSSTLSSMSGTLNTVSSRVGTIYSNTSGTKSVIKSIQRGDRTSVPYDGLITIKAVDITKSLVIIQGYAEVVGKIYPMGGYLKSSTTLYVYPTASSYVQWCTWQVIEFY